MTTTRPDTARGQKCFIPERLGQKCFIRQRLRTEVLLLSTKTKREKKDFCPATRQEEALLSRAWTASRQPDPRAKRHSMAAAKKEVQPSLRPATTPRSHRARDPSGTTRGEHPRDLAASSHPRSGTNDTSLWR